MTLPDYMLFGRFFKHSKKLGGDIKAKEQLIRGIQEHIT